MADNKLPDLMNLQESDIIGEWDVVSISHTDGPGTRNVGNNEIFIFSIKEDHQFIWDFNPFFTLNGSWKLKSLRTNQGNKPTIVTSFGSQFCVNEIKPREMKFQHGTIEYLLSKTTP